MHTRAAGAAVALVLLLGGAAGVQAATIPVTTTLDTLAADGQCSLREALRSADADEALGDGCVAGSGTDVISVPAGTFTISIAPTETFDPNDSGDVAMRGNVTLQGAGARATIVDAAGLNDRIVRVANGDNTIRGLTLRGGRALAGQSGAGGQPGGAVLVAPMSSLLIEDAALRDNRAGDGGVGVVGTTAEPGGTGGTGGTGGAGGAGGSGGAVYAAGGVALTLRRVLLTDNRAGSGGTGGTGGAVPDAVSCIDNTGGAGGTGGKAGDGAGVLVEGGQTVLEATTVTANQLGAVGAGGAGGAPSMVCADSPVSGTAGAAGGVGSGAGIRAASGTTTLNGSTLARNTGGEALVVGLGAVTTAAGTIFEAPGAACRVDGTGQLNDGGGNVRSGASCPGTTGTLALGPLAGNGGPTDTIAPGAGSVALDAVALGSAGCTATDARGIARPQGPACDAGAVEVVPAPVVQDPPAPPAPPVGDLPPASNASPVQAGRPAPPRPVGSAKIRVIRGLKGTLVLDLGFRVVCTRGGRPCSVSYRGEAAAGDDRLNLELKRLAVLPGRTRSARFTLPRSAAAKLRRARTGIRMVLEIEVRSAGVAVTREVTVTLRAPR